MELKNVVEIAYKAALVCVVIKAAVIFVYILSLVLSLHGATQEQITLLWRVLFSRLLPGILFLSAFYFALKIRKVKYLLVFVMSIVAVNLHINFLQASITALNKYSGVEHYVVAFMLLLTVLMIVCLLTIFIIYLFLKSKYPCINQNGNEHQAEKKFIYASVLSALLLHLFFDPVSVWWVVEVVVTCIVLTMMLKDGVFYFGKGFR